MDKASLFSHFALWHTEYAGSTSARVALCRTLLCRLRIGAHNTVAARLLYLAHICMVSMHIYAARSKHLLHQA